MAGTIVGAGMFTLPYVFRQVGLLIGIGYLVFFAAVYATVHLMYGALVGKHRGAHEFGYLASRYLPRRLSAAATYLILAELVLVLVAYLALAPVFAALFLPTVPWFAALGLWFFGTLFIFVGLRAIGFAEAVGLAGVLGIIGIIFLAGGFRALQVPLVLMEPSWPIFFLPFGPLLFSLSGRPAVSRVYDERRAAGRARRPFSAAAALVIGTFVAAAVYLLFVFAVLRLRPDAAPDTISSFLFLPLFVRVSLGLLGLVAIFTSYFVIGRNIAEIAEEDLRVPALAGAAAAAILPLGFYAFGVSVFVVIVAFTGGVLLGLEGVFVVWMWRRAFPRHRWRTASAALFVVFGAGIMYELVHSVLGG